MKTTPIRDLRSTSTEGDASKPAPTDYGRSDGVQINLPAWVTSRPVVGLAAFLVFIVVPALITFMQQHVRDQANTDCLAITTPGGVSGGFWGEWQKHPKTINEIRRTLIPAIDGCPVNTCTKYDGTRLSISLSSYLRARERMFNAAHEEFGPRGLRTAANYLNDSDDNYIFLSARKLLAAGLINTTSFTKPELNHLKLILKHPRGELPFCFTSNT